MMVHIRLAAFALLAATMSCVVTVADSPRSEKPPYVAVPQPFGYYAAGAYSRPYRKLVARARRALRSGDLEAAVAMLIKASRLKLSEPNFELWDEIGDAQCKQGKVESGRAYLNEYLCMVDQAVGSDTSACSSPWSDGMPPMCRALCGVLGPPTGDDSVGGPVFHVRDVVKVETRIEKCHGPNEPEPSP